MGYEAALKGKSHILLAKRWEELLFCFFHALPEIRSSYPEAVKNLVSMENKIS